MLLKKGKALKLQIITCHFPSHIFFAQVYISIVIYHITIYIYKKYQLSIKKRKGVFTPHQHINEDSV